jgi:transcriptional regulator with XRE-family HTH domain
MAKRIPLVKKPLTEDQHRLLFHAKNELKKAMAAEKLTQTKVAIYNNKTPAALNMLLSKACSPRLYTFMEIAESIGYEMILVRSSRLPGLKIDLEKEKQINAFNLKAKNEHRKRTGKTTKSTGIEIRERRPKIYSRKDLLRDQ